jgi:hypothetical protein
MFKTHSVLNKESVIVLVCSLAVSLLILMDLLIVMPLVYDAFIKQEKKITGLPINIDIVNEAIDILNK